MVRRYPKPPTLIKHLLLLCFRPEQWAEAARYPLRVTIAPALLAIVLAALAVGMAAATSTVAAVRELATHWDERFPALTLTASKLSVGKIPPGKTLPRLRLNSATVLVIDPTDKTLLESIDAPYPIVIGSSEVSMPNPLQDSPNRMPLRVWLNLGSSFLNPLGESAATGTYTIDGAHLTTWAQAYARPIAIVTTAFVGAAMLLRNLIWAALTAFLIMPLVALGAPRLAIPRRVAYRIALAVTVPLVVVGALLDVLGAAPQELLGSGEAATILWFVLAAALAFWAGRMANTMYMPIRNNRRP